MTMSSSSTPATATTSATATSQGRRAGEFEEDVQADAQGRSRATSAPSSSTPYEEKAGKRAVRRSDRREQRNSGGAAGADGAGAAVTVTSSATNVISTDGTEKSAKRSAKRAEREAARASGRRRTSDNENPQDDDDDDDKGEKKDLQAKRAARRGERQSDRSNHHGDDVEEGYFSSDSDDEQDIDDRPGAVAVGGNADDWDTADADHELDDQDNENFATGATAINVDTMVNAELVNKDAERKEALEEIMAKTVEAEAISPADLRRRKRRLLGGGCIVLVLVSVGALLAGLFVGKSDGVELLPTMQPSLSISPSALPSGQPSSSPTLFNDDCENARVYDGELPYFHSGRTDSTGELGDSSPATTCPLITAFDRGVWYQVQGRNGGCISASVNGKNFKATVAVYTGTCDGLLCVTENQDGEAEWTSQQGQTYYILVAGKDSSAGEYSLSVSDIGSICNNLCEDPVNINSLPFFFSGSTEGAPVVDPESGATSCLADLVSPTTSGVWFSILLSQDSCINVNTQGSELDTILALYEGECDGLSCITGTDDTMPDYSTELQFKAEANKRYRLLVGNSIFQGQDTFVVNITAPENGICGDTYHGLTCSYEANPLLGDYSCLYYQEGTPFPFEDRSSFLISTCLEYPFAEPTEENCNCFVVLGEDPFNVGLNDICTVCSFLPQSENATRDGKWDISYDCSNLINGDCVGRTENGTCIANDEAAPIFDLPRHSCLNATTVEAIPYSSNGTFSFFSNILETDIDAFQCSGIGPFVYIQWYAVVGTGSCLRVTTAGSAIDTKLALYTGECRSLVCSREDDDFGLSLTSQIEWFGNEGQEYHILLSSYDLLQLGAYQFNVLPFDCNSNGPCATWTEIVELPYFASSTTVDRPSEVEGSQSLSCSLVKPGVKGVWYTGQTPLANACITVSTAGSQFDTILAAYTGTSCTDLTCLVENDNSSDLVRSSEVSWTTEFEVLYYVFVGGVDEAASGDVRISVNIVSGPCA